MRRPYLTQDYFSDDTILAEWPLFQPGQPRVFSGEHPLIVPLVPGGHVREEFDGLVLEIENLTGNPLCAGLQLSDDGSPATVSSTGGREVLLPRVPTVLSFPVESFAFYGLTDPARRIGKIELLVRREHDFDQPHRLDVAVSFLGGYRRIPPSGPRLTGKGLEKVLNRDPAVALGPRDLTPYGPENPTIRIPPPVFSYAPDTLSRIMSGRIMGEPVGFPPDWTANPNGELEWRHFLHRHHFLRPLVRELARTGDKKNLVFLEQVLTDWILKNPVPLESDGGSGPAWETLTAAFRLREWLRLAGTAWNRADFSESAKSLLLRSIWEHARHLADYRGHPGNWRLLEAASLSLVGILFPEFTEAAAWREKGLERLEQEASLQFFPDGMHFEISPFYHGLCLQACLEVVEAAKHAGIDTPASIRAGLPQWFRTLAALYRPDFTRPSINDSGGFRDHEHLLLEWAGNRLALPDVLWAGSRGRLGCPPSGAAGFFPDAGLAVVRSDQAGRGLWILFRAGPPGAAHAHGDDLSLELSVRGRPVLVDPGIGRYAPSALTRYYRRAEAHSTILVSGAERPDRKPSFRERTRSAKDRFRRLSRPGLEMITGTRGFGVPSVTRSVALIAGRFVMVRDAITGTGRRVVRVHWQFAPGLRVTPWGEGNCSHAAYDKEQIMELVFLTDTLPGRVEVVEGRPAPPAGFVAHRGLDVPAPRLAYIFEVDLPVCLEWALLFPVPGEEWRAAKSDRGDIEFIPADGSGLALDAVRWETRVIPPCHTSG